MARPPPLWSAWAEGITAMTFPAARCPYAAKADGSGRPWNTVAVSF
ncbi:hypothetical protein ACS6O4_23475 [Enterobacter hormaechei subsp. steigerwaltii]